MSSVPPKWTAASINSVPIGTPLKSSQEKSSISRLLARIYILSMINENSPLFDIDCVRDIVNAKNRGSRGNGLAVKFCRADQDLRGFGIEAEWLVNHALA